MGQATTLNNVSSKIESLGDMSLSVAEINNINTLVTTRVNTLAPESLIEYKLNPGDVYRANNVTTRYDASEIDTFDCEATCAEVIANGDTSDAFIQYLFTRTASEDEMVSTDPGQIIAGGNVSIDGDTVNNDASQIIAGGNIVATLSNDVDNDPFEGSRTVTDSGTAISFVRDRSTGRDHTDHHFSSYQPAPVTETITVAPADYEDSAAFAASTDTDGNTTYTVTFADGTERVLTGSTGRQASDSSLFTQDPNAPNGFIIETDPDFANYRTWLSSDYLLSAISTDPATVQQRLGDGFYEQRLIREQVAMLTGRRFLEGYSNDETQYQQLMDEGVLFAQTYGLIPGVSLSAEQMAQLTSDIVWLVEQTITFSDGNSTQALVPQVYVRVQDGDLAPSGGLIAADNSLELNISNDLNNFGTIAGRRITDISAANINNLGGRVVGDDVTLTATDDINNMGGRVDAGLRLAAFAGNDIRVESTTRTQEVTSTPVGSAPSTGTGFRKVFNKPQYTASSTNTRTNIDRVAGLYVSDSNGLLSATAGRDLIFKAAGIYSAGRAQLLAGNDVRLETVTTAADTRVTWDRDNTNREYSRTEIGSNIQSRDDLLIQADQNLLARAAQVGSLEGALAATAGNNVEISAGEHMDGLDAASKHTSKGTFSSRTLITRDDIQQTTLQSSSFSGRTVDIQADQDVAITGSDVIADEGVNTTAGNNLTITSGQQRFVNNSERIENKSGLMSGGGFGFTVGSRRQSDEVDQASVNQRASTVGSLSGDVTLNADNDARVTSSDLLARDGDVSVSGDNVAFTANDNSLSQDELHRVEQSGLTIALTGGAIDTIQTIDHSVNRIKDTDNSRLQALHAWRIGEVAQDLPGQFDSLSLSNIGDDFSDPTNINTDAEGNLQGSGINLSISIGSSESEQRRQLRQSNAQGSTAFASDNLTVTARGDEDREGSGDITTQGALLQSNNTTLDAADEIILKSAENLLSDKSQSESSSNSIGISIGSGGLNFTLAASRSEGFTNQSNDQYLESQIIGNNTVNISSGSDTTLAGAQVRGEQITANIGGDLNIISQQDTSTYDQETKSISVGGSVGTSSSINLSMSELQANANYQAVQEQSGLFAGDGGFDVEVQNNTDLQGGVIVSTAEDTANNSLSTETLSSRTISNVTEYDIESTSVSVGAGANTSAGASGGTSSDSDRQTNTTYSAISQGTIDIRSGDTVALANVKNSEAEAHTVLENNFNQDLIQDVEETVEVMQLAGELVGEAVNEYAEERLAQAEALEITANKTDDPEEQTQLRQQAQDIRSTWTEDSYQRRFTTAIISGTLGGNVALSVANASVSTIGAELANNIGEAAESNQINQAAKYIAHAALGCGLGAASGGGCSSGAVGSVAGEAVADTVRANMEARITEGNMTPDDLERWQQQGVDMAQLAGGISALLLNGQASDLQTGARTAGNAATNNALFLIPVALAVLEIVDKSLSVKDAYDLAQAIHEGDDKKAQELATDLGIGVATEIIPGNKIAQKVWKGIKKATGGKVDDVARMTPEGNVRQPSGAENIATTPKLQDQLRQQNLDNIAKTDDRLAQVVQGSGTKNPNFGIGKSSASKADELGKTWVGDGAVPVRDQVACPGCLKSADGTRIYRPPAVKKNTPTKFNPTGVQANFVQLDGKGTVISNGHLVIE